MAHTNDDVELANRLHNTTNYANGSLDVTVVDIDEEEDKSLLTDDQEDDSNENSRSFLQTNSKNDNNKPEEQKSLKYFQWKRVFQLIRSDMHLIIIGTVALLIGNVALLAVPYFVGSVIDATTQTDTKPRDEAKSELVRAVVILSSIIAVATIFSIIRAFLYNVTGERAVRKLRHQLFESLVVQEIAFFDENKTGELLSRLASDCTVLQQTVTWDISTTIRSSVTLLSGIVMLFYISWKLTILSLIVLPIIIIVAVVYGRFVKKLSKEYQEALAKASDTANEAISNIRTVRSFAKEEYEMGNYLERINITYTLAKRRGIGFAGFTGAMTFLGNISVGAVLYYGGILVLDGELSAGQLTSFIIYSLSVATSLGNITGLYGDLMKAMGASERVFQLLDRKPKVNWKGGKPVTNLEGHIELRDVHFSYPSRPDVKVLNGINLDLKPGQVVALVGRSGGGKSTVALLIESFYYPTQGNILIDGQDLRMLDPQQWRQNVAIVSQEPTLFGTTIAENIAYGKKVPLEKIVEVAKMANAHQFITEFPNGYDTVVGERGIKLSGGQKQRIAIARALLIDPKILLLDEATSALDAESEYLVKQALDTLMKGRTVLVIAHRLSTVKNANTVCVVQKGKIIERGTHSELLNVPNGVYLKLVKRQLLQE